MNTKLQYLLTCGRKFAMHQGYACPSCGAKESLTLRRKYVVTELRRCQRCHLQFRTPTTSSAENAVFYQSDYKQGFTTDMPSADELRTMKEKRFKDTEKDITPYIDILSALKCQPGQTLFDYGCSWGYGSWQFMEAGYNVTAYEISVPRCEYAKAHLNINACSDLSAVQGPFDIFFSSHVLEHVPSVADSIALAKRLLKPGGLFVAFTPNGSDAYRQAQPDSWDRLWGLVHPNFLDDQFYKKAFERSPYLLTSSPYDLDAIKSWTFDRSQSLELNGFELLVAAKMS